MDIGNVRIASIESEMRQSYLDYAMSVIVQRALPDARDGFKPVHRRVIYAMHELGMRSNSRYRKSAGVVGEVLKNYHPHSDVAVYDTLVRMAQDFSLRYPLIDGQGNFGSVDGDPAAAMRYTESRMAQITDEMIVDIDKNTVDFKPNYDSSVQEPVVLPARLPNLLVNGSSGIAVGMATNMPPHNLSEICDAVVYVLEHPDATPDELMQIVKGPDFPTGGTILGTEGIRSYFATGRGRIVIRAKAFVEEAQRGNKWQIIVTELPYQVNKAVLMERIAEMVKDGRIDGISDMRDESDRSGMRMVMELKRDAQPMKVLNNLFKHSSLQQTFGVIMLALIEEGTQPRVLPLRRLLQEYIGHRQVVIRRRTEYDLDRARRRAHILEGFKIAFDNLDEVIQTIRRSQTTETARRNLMSRFGLSEIQANAILDMQLRRLASLERKKIEDEYQEVLLLIAELEGILADPGKVLEIIRTDMKEIKEKYGDERRTRIQEVSGVLNEEDLIPEMDVLVTITNRGYVKRIASDAYREQHRGGRGKTGVTFRDEDALQHILAANTHDSLLVFTNRGRVYQIKVHELPDAGRTAKGVPIVNVISLQPDETVTTLMNIKSYEESRYLFFTTRQGQVKRTTLDQFKTVRSNGLLAIGIREDDELAWVRQTSGSDEVLLVSQGGQAIKFNETDVRAMGRGAAGVIGMRLGLNDRVIAFEVVDPSRDLLVASERGFGKRTAIELFRGQGRGGKGVQAMKLTPKTGPIVAAAMVDDESSVMLMDSKGVVIRIAARTISRLGRSTQGVTLKKLQEDERLVAMTATQNKDDDGLDGVDPSMILPSDGGK